jgi:hypothetical protein
VKAMTRKVLAVLAGCYILGWITCGVIAVFCVPFSAGQGLFVGLFLGGGIAMLGSILLYAVVGAIGGWL